MIILTGPMRVRILLVALVSTLIALYKANIFTSSNPFHGKHDLWRKVPSFRRPMSPGDTIVTSRDTSCDWFPDTTNILVVIKTRATESHARIPVQLLTVLSCLGPHNYLIFSDRNQTIGGGVQIYDSLDQVLPDVAALDNLDFDLYRAQQACPVTTANEACVKAARVDSKQGWHLDKYKDIHITEKAWNMRPGLDWYLFVDADTYITFPTLVHWLRKLNPNKSLYLDGASLSNDELSYGGSSSSSSYMLSRGAMKDFIGNCSDVANRYDRRVRTTAMDMECCGHNNSMLSVALNETIQLQVRNAWPVMNCEKPSTIPFGPTHWCQPIVTMHTMDPQGVSNFWAFERSFYNEPVPPGTLRRPLLVREMYEALVAPRLLRQRDGWDNMSDDAYFVSLSRSVMTTTTQQQQKEEYEKGGLLQQLQPENQVQRRAHKSFGDCRALCRATAGCFQFRYQEGVCGISRSGFRLGKPADIPTPSGSHGGNDDDDDDDDNDDDGEMTAKDAAASAVGTRTWASGWILERIDE